MSRLPFEPSPPKADADRPFTVSALAASIKAVLSAGLPRRVRVIGEVSNFTDRSHWFFSLKDENATLRCVCFASSGRRIDCTPADGMLVVATGRVDFYDAQGSVQLYVDDIEPAGQGDLERRLRLLMEELRKLGYFDEARKKPLPLVPRKVAVVTSRTAAALQDVINTAHRRWPGCRLLLYDVRVQGAAAAPEIAAAINKLATYGESLGVDAIILTRGGGSIEDLWAFNERIVANAIVGCDIPIVAAIGHETDTTIAELCADARCSTPTQAAMTLIPDAAALRHQVDQLAGRMRLMLQQSVETARHRLSAAERFDLFRNPRKLVDDARRRLDDTQRRLDAAMPRRAKDARTQLHALSRQLDAVSPKQVLERGYSYTLGPDGRVLRQASAVQPGDKLTTHLAEGQVKSTVDGDARPPAKRKRKDTDAPGLFS